jgi:hypothetical protein
LDYAHQVVEEENARGDLMAAYDQDEREDERR